MGYRKLLYHWAVPLLLIIVAGRQLVLSQTQGLSAWHGGGFGMFASIDRDERRLLQVLATDCDGNPLPIELAPPADLVSPQELVRLRTFPDLHRLQALAAEILDASLQPNASGIYYAHQTMADMAETICLQQVQVQVWRLRHRRSFGGMWYEPVTPLVEVTR